MSKTYPAIEIAFAPEVEDDTALRDRLLHALDDCEPTAIEEAASAWRVFFPSAIGRDAALAVLSALADPRMTFGPLDVEDEDWARRSQADLEPVRVGHIIVAPPWCLESASASAAGEDHVLVVVPSMGFGTGHHASTRLCLALLQDLPVRDKTVVDVGTGSGVLALAAARLGARNVIAVDNDPDAIEAARENVALNQATDVVDLRLGDLRTLGEQEADIALANLTGGLLERAAADIVCLLRVGGHAIVSGVLGGEKPAVAAAFGHAGAHLVDEAAEDEWGGLLFEKVASRE